MLGKKKNRQSRKLDKVPIFARSTTFNAWVSLLEESWPDIGWHLLDIRARRKSTIEEIREVFEPVKQKIHNPGLATFFYRESTEPANPSQTLKNRQGVGELDRIILQTQSKRDEQQRSCLQAADALKTANPDTKETIQDVSSRRLQHLLQLDNDLERFGRERDALNEKSLNQAAYVYRSELLDYLLSKRYALNPRNLANALAGLPDMKWRQSYLRCSRMTFAAEARPEFQVYEVLSQIWNHHSSEFEEPPIELFRVELLKPSRKSANTKQFLRSNWRDLKFAISECWKSKPIPHSFPFVLTSIFMRNVTQQKDAAEQILAEQDRLKG